MTITPNAAIKRARDRVRICSMGDQYVVHRWSPRHNATFVGHPTQYHLAMSAVREGRICEALNAMGVEEAEWTACKLAEQEGSWDQIVREYARDKCA